MKLHTLVLIVMFLQSGMAGCTQETMATKGMTCQLSTDQDNDCSGTLVLESGVLKTDDKGQFELKGHYNACFHVEDVSIKGKYNMETLGNVMNIELLGTHIKGSGKDAISFPRTIGSIKLNKNTFAGTFVDIWAPTRAHGAVQEKNVLIKIKCKFRTHDLIRVNQ